MKHIFTIEIADSPEWPAPDPAAAYRNLMRLGKQGRLGECVTQVARQDERPATAADWRDALRGKTKKK